MAATPPVSVVVPTFQRRERVTRAIRSVIEQTFDDWELIVVDDGSTDGTGEAVAALRDPRLYYHWQPNGGLGAARNAGLRLARGPVVAFLDSDDRWRSDHLALVTEVFRRHPDALLVTTNPRWLLRGSDPPDRARLIDPLPLCFLGNFVGCPSAVAVQRDPVRRIGGFDEAIEVAEDDDLWYRLAAHGPFALLQHRTVLRTRGADSTGARGRREAIYPAVLERVAERGLDEARRARGEGSGLIAGAEGRLALARSFRALAEGNETRLRSELARACTLLPELNREPGALFAAVRRLLPESESRIGRLGYYRAAAAAWPDQRADTALALHGLALACALRGGRFATGARELRRLHVPSAARMFASRRGEVFEFWRRWFRQGPDIVRLLRRT
jgi:cellulose synthase/poly-beta-1,6-N-acetylglucosamine synthase-like glycosyltransferase